MRFLASLDYEMFFGADPGTVAGCMLEPTEQIARSLAPLGAKLTFFVDATFLLQLREECRRHPGLQRDFDGIRRQLARLVSLGHDAQLHVHPHWMDSHHDGSRWHISTRRYRLHDFAPADREEMVSASKAVLEDTVGRPVFAFRAGGWCLQPFSEIAQALRRSGIWLDSTVYPGGYSADRGRDHDFRSAPWKPGWRFSGDPAREDPHGEFVELPISSFRASPLLFWRMAAAGKLRRTSCRPWGEGSSMRHGAGYYLRRLVLPSRSVASVDGLKAAALPAAMRQWGRRVGDGVFHVMGHPKALTPFSLDRLVSFLRKTNSWEAVVVRDFANLKPGVPG